MVTAIAGATDYPLASIGNTVSAVTTNSLGTANVTVYTNTINIEQSKYHTVVISMTSTNAVFATNYVSLDGVSWFLFGTNIAGSTANFSTNFGPVKWKYFQTQLRGSNATDVITYLGGN